jgi:hypothetical protein
MDERKVITINSPAGCGNMFCQYLMENNLHFKIRWVEHNPELFDKDGLNILLLRNPYQTIASGLEVMFDDLEDDQKKYYIKNLQSSFDQSIKLQLDNYNIFLDKAKQHEYITTVGFKLLTEQPDLFLDKISKHFDIPFKENRMSAEDVKKEMQFVKKIGDRLPREASEIRKEINIAVNNYEPIKNVYDKYIDFKLSIDFSLKYEQH